MFTANGMNGSATGVQFMGFFGGVWLFFALVISGQLNWLKAALIASGALLLIAGALWVKRAARSFPQVPADPIFGRRFFWLNAAQWCAGFLLYQLLRWMSLEVYFVNSLAVIVGLHFFFLARLFHNPAASGTGAMLVAWAAASAAFAPIEHLTSITALGAGLILWQAAATALAVSIAATRQPPAQTVPCYAAPAS